MVETLFFDKGSVEYETEVHPQGILTRATWTIPDFMKLLNNKGIATVILSPIEKFGFTISHRDEMLCILFSTRTLSVESFLGVELKTLLIYDKREEEFTIREAAIAIKKRLIDTKDLRQFLTHLFIVDVVPGEDYNTHNLCHTDNGFNKRYCFLPNGSLYLKFEFLIKTEGDCTNPTPQLNEVLKNILREGSYSDVVIKSAEGDEFKVHKALLAGRSPVLKAIFEHNFTETTTNIVESPLESSVLRETLSFIYTDQAKVDEMPGKLLAAADYYQLDRLKTLCENALAKKLSVNNAIETLLLADLHVADALAQLTLDFIKQDKERLKSITKTEGWAKLNSVDLLKRIIE